MRQTKRQIREQRNLAFEAVVNRFEAPLLRYVTRIVCDLSLAQDVVQDTFLMLLRKWDGPIDADNDRLSGWLYRVAHNRAVDTVRRQSRRRQLHERHAGEQPLYSAPDRGDGSRVGDRALAAVQALEKLSDRERQLVVLKVFEEQSYKDIARISGLSVGNVGYILHHALRKLAAMLGQDEEEEKDRG